MSNLIELARSILRIPFPGASRGRRGGSGTEAEVEGTPFYVVCLEREHPNALQAEFEALEKKASLSGDTRPVVMFVRTPRRQPLLVMGAKTFAGFLDDALYREDDEYEDD